jgi:hypothetical protein
LQLLPTARGELIETPKLSRSSSLSNVTNRNVELNEKKLNQQYYTMPCRDYMHLW